MTVNGYRVSMGTAMHDADAPFGVKVSAVRRTPWANQGTPAGVNQSYLRTIGEQLLVNRQ